jgi:hypothetical protein
MRSTLSNIFVFIGIALLILANVTGIGVFLYQWGAEGIAISTAAWGAFKLWISMLGGGFSSIVLAILTRKV